MAGPSEGGRPERRETRAGTLRRLEALKAPEGIVGDGMIDTVGLYCPVPILKAAEAIPRLRPGQVLEVLSDDRVILLDMPAWCLSSGHEYLGFRDEGEEWRLFIRRR